MYKKVRKNLAQDEQVNYNINMTGATVYKEIWCCLTSVESGEISMYFKLIWCVHISPTFDFLVYRQKKNCERKVKNVGKKGIKEIYL